MEVSKFTADEKACQVRSNVKSMLIIFFDIQGTVHKEFVPPGQTANGKFYCEVLKQLRENIRRKRPNKWKKNSWFLHHDYAPAHTSLVVRQFLTSKNISDSPPHPIRLTSPSATFSYSPRWNYNWKGVVIHAETQEVIDTLTFENFQGWMKSWETRWDGCIHAQGDYFEGDGGK